MSLGMASFRAISESNQYSDNKINYYTLSGQYSIVNLFQHCFITQKHEHANLEKPIYDLNVNSKKMRTAYIQPTKPVVWLYFFIRLDMPLADTKSKCLEVYCHAI